MQAIHFGKRHAAELTKRQVVPRQTPGTTYFNRNATMRDVESESVSRKHCLDYILAANAGCNRF
jgi:hypothetical protein